MGQEIDAADVLEAQVGFRKDGDNILVPVTLPSGQVVQATITPTQMEALKTADLEKVRDIGTKTQWRVLYSDPNGKRSPMEGPWTDIEPTIETRTVPSNTPQERVRPQPGVPS